MCTRVAGVCVGVCFDCTQTDVTLRFAAPAHLLTPGSIGCVQTCAGGGVPKRKATDFQNIDTIDFDYERERERVQWPCAFSVRCVVCVMMMGDGKRKRVSYFYKLPFYV